MKSTTRIHALKIISDTFRYNYHGARVDGGRRGGRRFPHTEVNAKPLAH